jgi:hypothetical protein
MSRLRRCLPAAACCGTDRLPPAPAGLEISTFDRQKTTMRRACLLLLAVILAVATIAVPASRAAKAGRLGDAVEWRLAAQSESSTHGSVPGKRCQSGAGMLGCPFQEPAGATAARRAAVTPVRFHTDVAVLTGRTVPILPRPPKATLSA